MSPGHEMETAAQTAPGLQRGDPPAAARPWGPGSVSPFGVPAPRPVSSASLHWPGSFLGAFPRALGASLGPRGALALPAAQATWVLPPDRGHVATRPSWALRGLRGTEQRPGSALVGSGLRPADGALRPGPQPRARSPWSARLAGGRVPGSPGPRPGRPRATLPLRALRARSRNPGACAPDSPPSFQLAHVLPTEENFVLLFRCQQLRSCEEFMKVRGPRAPAARTGGRRRP